MFYFASYGDTGKQCQDGQVSCDRAIFWPEMMSRCGWDTNGRETGILAVIGSHHWGLALPYALDGVPSHLPRRYFWQNVITSLGYFKQNSFF